MAIIGNCIIIDGGVGESSAAIQVTYPEGSICTCSNGTKTLTAENTSGRYTFYIPKITSFPSEWAVECYNENDNDSETVTINAKGDLLTVTLNYFSSILNDNSWERISQAAQGGFGDTYWDIGDCKQIVLNGAIGSNLTLTNYITYVFILDFNHPINKTTADNNIIFGGFKTSLTAGTDIALCENALYNETNMIGKDGLDYLRLNDINFCINKANVRVNGDYGYWFNGYNGGGWKACDLRYGILGATSSAPQNYQAAKTTSTVGYDATTEAITSPVTNTLMAALPNDFRQVLRLHTHYVNNIGNSSADSAVTQVIDAGIFLLSEFEVFGSRSYANQYEQNHQKQMSYYAIGNSKIKYQHSSNSDWAGWWTTSPSSDRYFVYIRRDGTKQQGLPYVSLGLAPAFKV